MKKLLSACTVFLSLLVAGNAHAGFHIDPFVGYETGKFKSTTENNGSGTGFGARLGFSTLGFAYGAEYAKATLTVKGDPGEADSNLNSTDLGVFVGYTFPILVRAYATYFVSSTGGVTEGDFTGSGGTRLGVGYTGLPFVTLNLEVISRKYNKFKLTSGTEVDLTANSNTTALSVSLPF